MGMGRRKGKRGSRLFAVVRRALYAAGAVALIAAAVLGGQWLFSHAAAIGRLARGPSDSVFLDAEGNRWFALDPHRREVPLERVAPSLRAAVVAVEDHRFFSHHGIDPIAVARALSHNLRGGGRSEGASTITQQLARTLFLSRERTVSRKLARRFSRCCSSPGSPRIASSSCTSTGCHSAALYGVEAFALDFFGKPAAVAHARRVRARRGRSSGRRAPLSPRSHLDGAGAQPRRARGACAPRARSPRPRSARRSRARVRIAPGPPRGT